MNEPVFILKGNIIYSKDLTELAVCEHGYLVCRNGLAEGVYPTLPFKLGGNPIHDYGDCLIIPGLVDLHLHAPQYSFRGLGMDMELLEWLDAHSLSFYYRSQFLPKRLAPLPFPLPRRN